jgi:hypothetical protein
MEPGSDEDVDAFFDRIRARRAERRARAEAGSIGTVVTPGGYTAILVRPETYRQIHDEITPGGRVALGELLPMENVQIDPWGVVIVEAWP